MNDTLLADQPLTEADDNADYLTELTKPGAKFDRTKYPSEADMYKAIAKGKAFADRQVDFKNQEYDKLREDYIKATEQIKTTKTLEEMLDQMAKKPSSSETTLTANESVMNQPIYNPKEVEDLFEQKFREKTVQQTQTQNFNFVKEKLIESYGPNYQAHVKAQIEDLGISDQEFTALAKTNPKLIVRTLGLDQQRQDDGFQTPPRSTVRTDNFAPKGAAKRDWAFYEKMRVNDPKLYTNQKTQVQMHQDAIALGDAFG